jgi:hypothetical protein
VTENGWNIDEITMDHNGNDAIVGRDPARTKTDNFVDFGEDDRPDSSQYQLLSGDRERGGGFLCRQDIDEELDGDRDDDRDTFS